MAKFHKEEKFLETRNKSIKFGRQIYPSMEEVIERKSETLVTTLVVAITMRMTVAMAIYWSSWRRIGRRVKTVMTRMHHRQKALAIVRHAQLRFFVILIFGRDG